MIDVQVIDLKKNQYFMLIGLTVLQAANCLYGNSKILELRFLYNFIMLHQSDTNFHCVILIQNDIDILWVVSEIKHATDQHTISPLCAYFIHFI